MVHLRFFIKRFIICLGLAFLLYNLKFRSLYFSIQSLLQTETNLAESQTHLNPIGENSKELVTKSESQPEVNQSCGFGRRAFIDHNAALDILRRTAKEKCTVRNVALVKTHKCASDMMATILMRHADTHSLEMLLPQKRASVIGYFFKRNTFTDELPSRRRDNKFQLMTLHTFFNYPFWALLMQPPTALVGMIRHPFDQFSSFFDFFHVGRSLQTAFPFLDSHSTFDFFLNYSTQLLDGNLRNRWRNLEIYKIGLRDAILFDYGAYFTTNRTQLAHEVVNNFSVIMHQEKFDESLVLLKTVLNWDYKDILYLRSNNNQAKLKTADENNKTSSEYQRRLKLHKKLSPHDYILHELSLEKFNHQISLIENFDKQVQELKNVNNQIGKWCTEKLKQHPIFYDGQFPKLVRFKKAVQLGQHLPANVNFTTEFSHELISINEEDCFKMQLSMLDFVEYHQKKYHREI